MKIVLASSSIQRQNIFKMLGLKYEVVTSNALEFSKETDPFKYVCELSLTKAQSVSEQLKDASIIISADTIIYYNGKIYEKPKTKAEAINNLKELSGHKHLGITGITIKDLYQNKTLTFSSKVDIYLKKINIKDILWYVDNESRIFSCCGYVPLGKGSIFIDKIVGDYNTLFGLSPSILFRELKKLGYEIDDFEFEEVK